MSKLKRKGLRERRGPPGRQGLVPRLAGRWKQQYVLEDSPERASRLCGQPRRLLRSRRGATLAELLVTFALLSLFLTAAAAILTPATVVYQKVKYQSYARNVCDMVLEKVCSQIAGASTDPVTVADDGSAISFSDSQASPLFIDTLDGYLRMHYREIKVIEGTVVTQEVLWPAVDWQYDPKAYQGFTITSLTFQRAGGGDCVQVSLEIANEAFGTSYASSRTVECYNLDGGRTVTEGEVFLDDDEYYEAVYGSTSH